MAQAGPGGGLTRLRRGRSATWRYRGMRFGGDPGAATNQAKLVLAAMPLRFAGQSTTAMAAQQPTSFVHGHGRGEQIPAVADRLDDHRELRVGLDLSAKPHDLHVDAAIEQDARATASEIQQLFAAQDDLRMLDKGLQQLELAAGQLDQLSARRAKCAVVDVEAPIEETEDRMLSRTHPGRQTVHPPQHSADARQKLPWLEGLADVVVCAELETDDAIGFAGHGGQQHDGNLAFSAQLAAEREAVVAREHDVEHDEVDVAGLERIEHFLAVLGLADAQSLRSEKAAKPGANPPVIVDDQNVKGTAQSRLPGLLG